jgi:hypothetical protein
MTQAFNLSQFANKVNTSGEASLTTAVTGTLPVANGGTGAASLTGNSVTITDAGGTALTTVAAGANGNVLTSNGTTWTSAAASGGQLQTQMFGTPGTWTKPASCTQVRVTVIGGSGGTNPGQQPGGGGGIAIAMVPVSAPVAITVGTGGAVNASGGTSSFGPAVSATGGAAGSPSPPNGTGTVSVGTALRTSSFSSALGGLIIGVNSLFGIVGNSQPTYSVSGANMAGSRPLGGPGATGNGGAILVEFIG